ncbi:MAG: cyclic nucleotide-binding domain-containing protein [bacterium]|nr:cyclic nucleotide-binding domain-containing protein [bacterium]
MQLLYVINRKNCDKPDVELQKIGTGKLSNKGRDLNFLPVFMSESEDKLFTGMHPFQEFIERYTPLPKEDWEKIEPHIERFTLSKGQTILKEGEYCKNLYFLETGLLKFFKVSNGESITKFFTKAPYTFTSQKSFIENKPSKENIVAIENSVLWKVDRKKAFQLLQMESWNTFVRKLVQEVQYYRDEVLEEVHTNSAEERYQNMVNNNEPTLMDIPLKHLNSYFGIAPLSSRIKRKVILRDC